MKLYFSPASPFVRKALIVAHECGLANRIETVEVTVQPGNPNRDYGANRNPLRQIPVLETDEGENLFDSFVICDYLARLSGNTAIVPADGSGRTRVLKIHALCNGITERAVQTRYESFVRPEPYRWPAMIDDNMDRIHSGLKLLDGSAASALSGPFDLADAAFVAMLRYLDLRYETIGWRTLYPNLVAPFEALDEMACVKAAYA